MIFSDQFLKFIHPFPLALFVCLGSVYYLFLDNCFEDGEVSFTVFPLKVFLSLLSHTCATKPEAINSDYILYSTRIPTKQIQSLSRGNIIISVNDNNLNINKISVIIANAF